MDNTVARILIVVLLIVSLAACTPRMQPVAEFVPGRILVLKAPQYLASRAVDVPAADLLAQHGIYVMRVPEGTEETTVSVMRLFGIRAELDYVAYPTDEPSEPSRIFLTPIYKKWRFLPDMPDDPLFSEQWSLDTETGTHIGYLVAYPKIKESRGTTLAVLDTGFGGTVEGDTVHYHEEFGGRVIAGQNFIRYGETPVDTYGHGSHVGTTAAGETGNGLGIAGIDFKSKLLNCKVCDWSCPYSSIAAAIIWATDNGATVLNMSFAGSAFSEIVQEAIDYAAANDVLPVAAAANSGRREKFYPCACAGVLCVAATNPQDEMARFSTFGWNQMCAPGTNILAVWCKLDACQYRYASGTSMAAPHVSGAASVLRSLWPELSKAEIEQILYGSAVDLGEPGKDERFGWGRLDLGAAVGLGNERQ